MDFVSFTYLLWAIAFLALVWVSAHKYSPYILTAFGLGFVFSLAPYAGLLLVTEALIAFSVIHYVKRKKWIYAFLLIILIFGAFLVFKYYAQQGYILLPLGISYYTFRLLHYVQDSYRGNIRKHTLIEFMAYISFFPTYLIGPINLFPDFLLNIRRRRWDVDAFSRGLERAFYGYAQLIILGNFLVNDVVKTYVEMLTNHTGYTGTLFLESAHLWLDLYVRFSAYSSIAIGISVMAGFKVPENFRYPFLARNIREFWQRWHISLTDWCREYIFVPVAAITRRPYLAIGATMITIGIWHELSIRYILWGLYHSVGIIIFEKWSAFIKDKLPESRIFQKAYALFGILLTIIFVVSSFPVTTIAVRLLNSLIS